MWTRYHRQRNLGRLIVPALTSAVVAYFGFHAYHGEYGIYSKYQLRARVAALQLQLDEVRTRRIALEQRVHLIHDGSIEKDMLDERARMALNLTRPGELVIMRTNGDAAPPPPLPAN